MPLQNRVTPLGEIIATPERGTMMGNRGGALHAANRTLGPRRWASRQWICCRLDFHGRRRQVMAPGRYTELFFLDEATALAAGHRPCFECRRADALAFAEAWSRGRGLEVRASAGDMDRVLHAERLGPAGAKRKHGIDIGDLPACTMILAAGSVTPLLVLEDRMHAWSAAGYGRARPRPRSGAVEALTPPSIVAALLHGYRPTLHRTATGVR